MSLFDTAVSSIFSDIRYLKNDYLPSQLIGRDDEIKSIVDAYRPIFINGDPRNLILFGKSGTGKKTVSEYVVNHLEKTIKDEDIDLEVIKLHVSCREAKTSTAVLLELIEGVKGDRDVPNCGLGLRDYLKIFKDIFQNGSNQLIIVWLNDFHFLKNDDILDTLSRANEKGLIPENTKLSIIATTTTFNYKKLISPEVASFLHSKEILFNPYSETQLIDILNDRRDAFLAGVIDDAVIPLCSQLSAADHGDARRTIQLLKESGYLADENGDSKVAIHHVREINEAANVGYLTERIDLLTVQEKGVLLAVVQLSYDTRGIRRIKIDAVVSEQNEIAKGFNIKPVSRHVIPQILNNLESIQLISLQKDNVGGNTSIIKLGEEITNELIKVETYLKKSISKSHT